MYKKGWMRIVEASVAVIIILSVLFTLYQNNQVQVQEDLSVKARAVLEELSRNSTLRNDVLNNNVEAVRDFVRQRVDNYLEVEVRICELNEVCGKSTYTPGDVYAVERIISTTPEHGTLEPKKVRIFLWRTE